MRELTAVDSGKMLKTPETIFNLIPNFYSQKMNFKTNINSSPKLANILLPKNVLGMQVGLYGIIYNTNEWTQFICFLCDIENNVRRNITKKPPENNLQALVYGSFCAFPEF